MVYIWNDKRRWFFGTKYLSSVKYKFNEDKIIIDKGLLRKSQYEIKLYQIIGLDVRQSILDRILRVGTIVITSTNFYRPRVFLQKVKKPFETKESISDLVEKLRDEKGLGLMNLMFDNIYGGDHQQ